MLSIFQEMTPQSPPSPDDNHESVIPLAVPVIASSLIESDLKLAQRLQAEEDARACYSSTSPTPTHLQQPTVSTLQDEAYARRLDQELRDQQYAQSLQEQEHRNSNHLVVVPASYVNGSTTNNTLTDVEEQRAHALALQQQEELFQQRRRRSRRRNCIITISLFILVGGSVAGTLYFGNFFGNRNPFIPYINDPWNNKAGNGTSLGDYEIWPNKGNGLKLTIQNALTTQWYPFLKQAVIDWDAAPALTLTVVNATKPDPTCSQIRGILKVCNSDYGDTGWLGINDSVLQSNVIYSSTSRMNEYYLNKSSNALRQYVMCHEIGHGFGLPHRDENFNNPDLGSCLDYTSRPQNNMHPNSVDFDHLAQLYLPKNQNTSRILSSSLQPNLIPISTVLPSTLLHFSHLEENRQWSYTSGRLLHKSKYSEIWETNLKNNIRIRTKILLIRPS